MRYFSLLFFAIIGSFVFAHSVLAQACVTQYSGTCETQVVCNAQVQQGTHTVQANAGCTNSTVCCVPSKTTATDQSQGKGDTTVGAYQLKNPLGSRSISQIIAALIRYAAVIAGGLFMLYLIWGGLQWMTAQGDGGAVKKAQGKIVYSIVGIIVMFLSYFVIDTLIRLTNVIQ